VFIQAKDDGGGGDSWTTAAISRAKLQSHHHHQQTNNQFFSQAGYPSSRPTKSMEWKNITFHGLAQAHLGSSNFVS